MISPIDRLSPLDNPYQIGRAGKNAENREDVSFGSVFKSAVQSVREADKHVSETAYLMSTGQLDNPAQMGIALFKNELAVSMLVQLRNKSVEAYNEIMRTGM